MRCLNMDLALVHSEETGTAGAYTSPLFISQLRLAQGNTKQTYLTPER